jgi:small subunit ribosomal protein S16
MGRRNRPFYRINAVEKRNKRDGRVLENLGWYDPESRDVSKQVSLKEDRIKHWLSNGAQPSDTVNDLLAKASIIDAEKWQAERRRRTQKKYEASLVAKEEAQAAARAQAEADAKAKAEAAAAEAAKSAEGAEVEGSGEESKES